MGLRFISLGNYFNCLIFSISSIFFNSWIISYSGYTIAGFPLIPPHLYLVRYGSLELFVYIRSLSSSDWNAQLVAMQLLAIASVSQRWWILLHCSLKPLWSAHAPDRNHCTIATFFGLNASTKLGHHMNFMILQILLYNISNVLVVFCCYYLVLGLSLLYNWFKSNFTIVRFNCYKDIGNSADESKVQQ